MNQKNTFLSGEGNMWYQRNKSAFTPDQQKNDPILIALDHCFIQPSRVLEIGCANGWRLAQLHNRYGCQAYGIDPSETAIINGSKDYPEINLSVGTADKLPEIEPVDLIIFGFCLYLCDRNDLFKIAEQANKYLSDDGFIIIYDFNPPFGHYRNQYKHKDNIYSYKMDYSSMFTWHPAYQLIYKDTSIPENCALKTIATDDIITTQIIRKKRELENGSNPF